MKNFFKKLSFVMAAAMVISSLYAPAAKAAAKDSITLKGKAISKKSIFVGGEKVNFDYKIGKFNNKGANGKWSTSDTSIITVNKHGVVTAVGTGDATLMLKVKKNKKKGIKKELTFKVKLTAFARASKLEIPASDKAISLKVGETKDIIPTLTNKVDGVDTTYNVFAKSSDENVATAKVDGKKVTVEAKMASATPATITVFAAQKSNEDDAFNNKYKVEDSFTVKVIANLEAKQSGAKTIKVSGADLSTDAAMYVLKNANGIKQNLKSVTVNTEKTEATLETYAVIAEGKYTLTYDKTDLPVDIVKVMVSDITLTPADKAIRVDDANAKVSYALLDQFGNDVTKEKTSEFNIVDGTYYNVTESAADKTLTFTVKSGSPDYTGIYKMGSTLKTLTVVFVHKTTGFNKTFTLEVGEASKLDNVSVKGLYNTKKKEFVTSLVEKVTTTTGTIIDDLALLVDAKDQYGKQVTTGHDGINFVVGNTNLKLTAAGSEKVNDVEYLKYNLETKVDDDNVLVPTGTVSLFGVLVNSGKTFNGSFEVTAAKKVASITVSDPGNVYDEEEAILEYVAMDNEGNATTDPKLVNATTVVPSVVGNNVGTLTWGVKDGKAVLKFKSHSDLNVTGTTAKSATLMLTIGLKPYTTSINVNPERYPNSIIGIDEKAVVAATRGGKFEIKYSDLKFADQKGNPIDYDVIKDYNSRYNTNNVGQFGLQATLKEANKYFTFGSSSNDAGVAVADKKLEVGVSYDGSEGVQATDGSLANKIVVTLLKNNKSGSYEWNPAAGSDPATKVAEYEFDIYNVKVADVENIKLNVKDLYAAHDLTSEPNSTTPGEGYKVIMPEITGTYKGKNISLSSTKDFKVIDGVDEDGATGTAKDIAYILRPEKSNQAGKPFNKDAEPKTQEDKTEIIKKYQIVVNDNKGTTLEGSYKFSNVERKVVKLVPKNDGELRLGSTAHSTSVTVDNMLDQFTLVDQYGEEKLVKGTNLTVANVFVTYGNITDLTVTKNGLDATVQLKNASDKVKTKVRILLKGMSTPLFDGELLIKE